MEQHFYFPIFIDLSGRKVLVAGGGRIALRRVKTLLVFEPEILVVAPRMEPELLRLASDPREQGGRLQIRKRAYCPGDLEGADLVLAATDDREVNRSIWSACRERGIPVNVADDKSLCDFYFPSVIAAKDVVIGLNSGGADPGRVRQIRQQIEEELGKEEGNPNWITYR